MTGRRRTLGAHLAWLVTLSTALGLAVFTAVATLVVVADEVAEDDELDDVDEPDESAMDEVLDDLGTAVLVATPLGLLVAIGGARWAARRVTARIDALIATASRMTAENLGERLSTSSRGDELDDLVVALNALFGRIDDGVAALRSFAADASHELRTPLAVTISALEIARRRPRELAEWERISDQTLDELRRMAELTEALLHSARTGAFDVAGEPVDVDAELEAIVGHWRAAASAAGVTVEVDAASGAAVRIDPRGLAIAIGNLIGNAIAHAPRGTAVTVRTRQRDQHLRVEVDDHGPGVAAHDRVRIFEPFTRGDAAPRDGVGLGLSIARRIVEAHRGSIEVDDAPGGGARFAIELPTEGHPS